MEEVVEEKGISESKRLLLWDSMPGFREVQRMLLMGQAVLIHVTTSHKKSQEPAWGKSGL